MNNREDFLAFVTLLGAVMFIIAPGAFAQEVVQPHVVIPWGDWLSQIVGLVGSLLIVAMGGLLTWAATYLPASLRAYINSERIKQVEQLLDHAVDYGTNAVQGAVAGQEFDVHVGSQVVAEAAQYAVDNGPKKLIDWMGGIEGIKQKIIARIPLSAQATADKVWVNTVVNK